MNKFQGKLSLKRIKKLNSQFINRIRNTKFVYTCGSMMKFPVTKFFEIPSQSSVLICDEFYGMRHLSSKNHSIIYQSRNLKKIFQLKIIN